ncbi:MAG: lasso peptide biosynthesis B2 protein [Pseudomonadota bacterium]
MKALPDHIFARGRSLHLYVSIWLTLAFVRIKLSTRGYKYFANAPVEATRENESVNPARIARIVERVAKFVPGALCLAQSVSTQRLLAQYGLETVMRIGVKSDEYGMLKAHAWVLLQGDVILGGNPTDLEAYKVITDMKSVVVS